MMNKGTWLKVCALTSLVAILAAVLIIFATDPTKGIASSHMILVLALWSLISTAALAFRLKKHEEQEVSGVFLSKAALLSLVASFPVPAVLFLLPYGNGADLGDVIVVVIFSSLAYLYVSRTIE